MLRRRRLIGVGIIVAAIVATWLGIAKPNPFRKQEVVHAMFDHVQSIALVQRDVRAAGVDIGSIGRVRRVGTHAEVDLLLDQRIPVYRNATAVLRPHTPFEGTTFVDLDPGTPGAGRLGSAPIPLSQTRVFVSAGDVLSTFTAPVRQSFQVIVSQLAQALTTPGRTGLSIAIHNAPALLQQTSVVAPALRGPHRTELRHLIRPLAYTVDALAGRDGELQSVIHNASRTLDAVAVDGARPFDRSLGLLPSALSGATAAAQRIVGVIHQAEATSATLTGTLREIPPTTRPLTGVLDRARATFPRVPPVITNFSGTLGGLARAAPALERLFATLVTPASVLRYELDPFLNSDSGFGLPVYLQLFAATEGFTGTLSSFTTPKQTGLATGHALRGTIQAPLTLPLGGLNSPIPCSVIAAINPGAVQFAEEFGLCTP
jgi:phospholipid/cholesterol/gamma-HCH transport system substrate-binding protein